MTNFEDKKIQVDLDYISLNRILIFFNKYHFYILITLLILLSFASWFHFSSNGLNLSYNDAMSHLDISRRVIDNIEPGLTQLGSVWLPLPHVLMLPTIWIDYFWRSGLSAGIISMASYILTAIITYKTVRLIGGNAFLGVIGAGIIAINPNFLYLQTTALTEPLFIALFSASMYFLLKWAKTEKSNNLIYAGFFIFLSTLTRYDGWFLLVISSFVIFITTFFSRGWQIAKGRLILFATLAFFGVFLWLLYNQLIFGNALYFANSEFSAGSQQATMAEAGALPTKGNLILSIKTYYYAIVSNVGFFTTAFAALGWIYFMYSRKNKYLLAIGLVFISPVIFNILSLFIGQSVIFLPETVGNSWFNVRYGLIVLPLVAVFAAYLLRLGGFAFKGFIVLIIILQSLSFIHNDYIITVIDGVAGASQKNVKGLGQEIGAIASNDTGLILASAASHDAILFSSNMPMNRFIHEGTGNLWDESLKTPEKNAEFIIMRTNDNTDSVSRALSKNRNFSQNYTLRYHGNFADFYQRTIDYKETSDPTSKQINNKLSWQYKCIDTMKHSRDLARESLNDPEFSNDVKKYILAIKNSNANCVAVGTPYDEEFLPILKTWADETHKAGLKVWFRGNWSGWEGWFNYPKDLSREEHLAKTEEFLISNQALFKVGDIFTACPECEYGGPGNPLSTGDRDGYKKFMIDEHNLSKSIFEKNNKNITTNLSSMNTDVAKAILDNETLDAMDGVIVLDHYAKSVEDYKNTLNYFIKKFPDAKIILGEFGAPVPDIHGELDSNEQARFINEVINFLQTRKEVIGLNYWVGAGGTTSIFNNNYSSKPATEVIAYNFKEYKLTGSIKDKKNYAIANVTVSIPEYKKTIKSNQKGEFEFIVSKGDYNINSGETEKYNSEKKLIKIKDSDQKVEIILTNKNSGFLYIIKNLLKI